MSNWGLKVSGVLLAGLLGGVLFHAHSQASGASSDPWLDAVKASVGVGDFRISRKAPLADGPLMDMTPLKVDLNTLRGSGLTQVIQMLGDTKRRIVLKPAPSPAESGKVQAATWDDAKKEVVVEVYGRFVDERTVPGVNTLQAKEAFRKIQDAGLLPKAERGPSAPSALEAYTVKEVIPPAGSIVAKDSEVRVILYGKPETVKRVVPNLRNLTVDEAKKQLPAGLQLRETVGKEAASKSQANTIYEQDPVLGVELADGQHVMVTTYGEYRQVGPAPDKQNDVDGKPGRPAKVRTWTTLPYEGFGNQNWVPQLPKIEHGMLYNSLDVSPKDPTEAPKHWRSGHVSFFIGNDKHYNIQVYPEWFETYEALDLKYSLKTQDGKLYLDLPAGAATKSVKDDQYQFVFGSPTHYAFVRISQFARSYQIRQTPITQAQAEKVAMRYLRFLEPYALPRDGKTRSPVKSESNTAQNPPRTLKPLFDAEIGPLPDIPDATIFGQ